MDKLEVDESEIKNDDEKGDIDFKTQSKIGPSSALTAVEWDGGITLEDVHESFDDDEDADTEYAEEEPIETTPKLEKGKGRAVPIQVEPEIEKEKQLQDLKKNLKTLRLIDLPLDVLKEVIREVRLLSCLCDFVLMM